MHFLDNLMNQNAYSLSAISKHKFFLKHLNFLTSFHYKKSNLYKKYLKGIQYDLKRIKDLSDIPLLPVRLFKEFDFLSIKKKRFLIYFFHPAQLPITYLKFI